MNFIEVCGPDVIVTEDHISTSTSIILLTLLRPKGRTT